MRAEFHALDSGVGRSRGSRGSARKEWDRGTRYRPDGVQLTLPQTACIIWQSTDGSVEQRRRKTLCSHLGNGR